MDRAASLFEVLTGFIGVFWKDWPIDIEPRTIGSVQNNTFSISGTCPHCSRPSVFLAVTAAHGESLATPQGHQLTLWAGMQCQGCGKYILASVRRPPQATQETPYVYVTHYPLGKPSDDIAPEIPTHIGADFQEAMRCRFVDAHNATVEMCRRAVQASCLHLNAPADKKLVHQIDWLSKQGIITNPLKEMAHRVRLGGNLGAHPPEDPDDGEAIIIGPEYSDAVIEFTRDFFQHVYVMPARLKKFTFKKAPPAKNGG